MSFIHFTAVGHFDSRGSGRSRFACARPVDAALVARLLAEHSPEVAARVTACDD